MRAPLNGHGDRSRPLRRVEQALPSRGSTTGQALPYRMLGLTLLIAPFLVLAAAVGADDEKGEKSKGKAKSPAAPIASVRKSASAPVPEVDAALEADALAFVREHHPELATVLEALKPMNPAEYRKAIAELSQVSRTLAELKSKNPRRYELILDGWKAKSRVELLAAQLAGSPSEELRSQLRSAIEAKVEAEILRQRYELEQAEAAAKKARENLDRLEKNREAIVDARFRALQPKKLAKVKKPASATKAAPTNPANPANPPARTNPNGEDR
jgi:hypothetical protein